MQGPGMPRYEAMIAQAREKGTVRSGPLGLDGWKTASKATMAQLRRKEKAKAKKRKERKQKRTAKRDAQRQEILPFDLVSEIRESGDFSQLVPLCADGLTIKQILEWHEQETFARNQAEQRSIHA